MALNSPTPHRKADPEVRVKHINPIDLTKPSTALNKKSSVIGDSRKFSRKPSVPMSPSMQGTYKHLVLAPLPKFEYNYQVNSTRAYKKAAILF